MKWAHDSCKDKVNIWTKDRSATCGVQAVKAASALEGGESVNMSLCDSDKVILSGGGNEPRLFHKITFCRGNRHRGWIGNKWFWGRYLENCFKMTASHSCSGPGAISCYVITSGVSVQVLFGFLLGRSGDRETAKEAEKIASQIVAAKMHLCLSWSPRPHSVTLCRMWWISFINSTSRVRRGDKTKKEKVQPHTFLCAANTARNCKLCNFVEGKKTSFDMLTPHLWLVERQFHFEQ